MLFAFSVAPTVSDPDGSVHRAVADAVAIEGKVQRLNAAIEQLDSGK